jgi:hypothetical protein
MAAQAILFKIITQFLPGIVHVFAVKGNFQPTIDSLQHSFQSLFFWINPEYLQAAYNFDALAKSPYHPSTSSGRTDFGLVTY